MIVLLVGLALLVGAPSWTHAGDYSIVRGTDGPYSSSISGIPINSGSTLVRESILFNDPTCPVTIASHNTDITYNSRSRSFRFSARTAVDITKPIVAIKVSSILYDAFGDHMKNLGNTQIKDFGPGAADLHAEWRASERDVADFLTTVTYVSRVRMADGSQWIFNRENLDRALSTLHLEKRIADSKR